MNHAKRASDSDVPKFFSWINCYVKFLLLPAFFPDFLTHNSAHEKNVIPEHTVTRVYVRISLIFRTYDNDVSHAWLPNVIRAYLKRETMSADPARPCKLLLARELRMKRSVTEKMPSHIRQWSSYSSFFVSRDKDDNAAEAPTCLCSNLHVIG